MDTIRDILIANYKNNKQPQSISELARRSEVARETITKMQNGDYMNVRFASIKKVFNALGYNIYISGDKIK